MKDCVGEVDTAPGEPERLTARLKECWRLFISWLDIGSVLLIFLTFCVASNWGANVKKTVE